MTTSPEFRAGTDADLDAVRQLLAAAGLPFEDLGANTMRDFRVLYESGRLVAAGGIEHYGNDALLRSVVVAESARGRGLGTAITGALEAVAKQRGISRLFLLTTTAENFFPRLGYAPFPRKTVPEAVARSTEFASLCPASAACLVKSLR